MPFFTSRRYTIRNADITAEADQVINASGADAYHSIHDAKLVTPGTLDIKNFRLVEPTTRFDPALDQVELQVYEGIHTGLRKAVAEPATGTVDINYIFSISRSSVLNNIWDPYVVQILRNKDFREHYLSWATKQKLAFLKANPNSHAPESLYSFRTYMDKCRESRKNLIRSMGGTTTTNIPRPPEYTRLQHIKNWPGLLTRKLPLKATPTSLDDTVTLLKSEAQLRTVLEKRFDELLGSHLLEIDPKEEISGLIVSQQKARYVDEILLYARNTLSREINGTTEFLPVVNLAGLDKRKVEKLIGKKNLHEIEVVERLADSVDFLSEIEYDILPLRELWGITGIHGVLQKAITRSGKQHAYVYEFWVVQSKYVDRLGIEATQSNVYLAQKINGRDFADFIEVRQVGVDANGKPRFEADLDEAKSYENGKELPGANGEFLRQLGSHCGRMWDEYGELVVKPKHDGSDEVIEAAFTRKIKYYVNSAQLTEFAPRRGSNLTSWEEFFAAEVDRLNQLIADTSPIPGSGAHPLYDEVMQHPPKKMRPEVWLRIKTQIENLRATSDTDLTVQQVMYLKMTADASKITLRTDLVDHLMAGPALQIFYELHPSPIRYNQ